MIHIEALQSLVPNCIFTWEGQEWSGLEWLDERPCPTIEEWENEKQKIINEKPIKEKQFIIKKLLLESDYIELPSFLERKGQETYNLWMTYRTNLRSAYHDVTLPIPEKPQ
jgi:hypothetical protein